MTSYSRLPQAHLRYSIGNIGRRHAEAAAQARACPGELPILGELAESAGTPTSYLLGRTYPAVPPGNGA